MAILLTLLNYFETITLLFPQIDWFHNDQPIQIGSRIHTISDFGFVVVDIDWTFKRDSGVYTCRATNRFGTAESTANLVVSSKKDINLDSQLPQGMSLDKLKDLEKVCDSYLLNGLLKLR